MKGRRENDRISGMMILAIIIVVFVLATVTFAFEMLQKRQEKLISTAQSISQNETTMEIQNETSENKEAFVTEASMDVVELSDSQETDDSQIDYEIEGVLVEESAESGTETVDVVYLIKGNDKSSNKYTRVDRLSYTDSIRYTEEQLACLDNYGLRITRNEIYARHGRMFNDQELQEYFTSQSWYVPQSASGDFDEECLNEVEKYNSELIRSFELKQWND
ncbi:MAG: YARHG domain-containing protein [Lachnospiraceae bacterium]|nr:YARHG domain-containing protein [Lachnospiraceae bacterium]